MNIRFLTSATLAYWALTMAIAVPWHFVFFEDLFQRLGTYNREPPIMALGMSAVLIQGVVLGYLYPMFAKRGRPLPDGVRFGLVMGLFLFSVSTLANAAKMQVTSMTDFVVIQAAFHFIQFTIAGAAIGLLFDKLGTSRA